LAKVARKHKLGARDRFGLERPMNADEMVSLVAAPKRDSD
jgi:hypothetical protein